MKLFRGHAVLPLVGWAPTHVVRTYLAIAATREEARERILAAEPGAVFVTTPEETPAPHLSGTTSLSERELSDLRSADEWHEKHRQGAAPSLSAGPTDEPAETP